MNLNYKVSGEGEPLIILHGLFGMLDNWATVGRELSQHYKVYLVDQRNHGKSPHSADFNYDILAEDINALMSELSLSHAHLIGHSMGGKSVMQFAQKYPEKCLSITVIDIAPKSYKAGHNEIFEAIESMDLANISNRKEADAELGLGIKDVGVRQFLLKNLGRNKEKGFEWKANFSSLRANYESIIGNIEYHEQSLVKSLFIRGTRSHYVLAEDDKLIKGYFSNVQIKDLDTGHWIHAEQPKALMNIIMEFIEEKQG